MPTIFYLQYPCVSLKLHFVPEITVNTKLLLIQATGAFIWLSHEYFEGAINSPISRAIFISKTVTRNKCRNNDRQWNTFTDDPGKHDNV